MHHPHRILVVDDNEINRDILVTRLEAHGYQALQAADDLPARPAGHSPFDDERYRAALHRT